MKKRYFLKASALAVLAFAGIACSSFILLQQPVAPHDFNKPAARDTIPKAEFETGRLDDAIKYLDERMKDFGKEWTETTDKRIKHQIDAAMAQIDFSKARLQAMDAVKKIDWDKINRDIATATARVNKAEMDKKVKDALRLTIRSLDKEKIRSQVDAAMQNIDQHAIKIQIEDARRKLQDQKINLDMHFKELSPRIDNELMKTRRQLQRLKDASLQMQREGLIDKGLNNKIQYIDGRLYINGVQQTDKVSEHYKHYFMEEATPANRETITVVV